VKVTDFPKMFSYYFIEINAFGGVTATLKFAIPELDEVEDDIVCANEIIELKEEEELVIIINYFVVG